MSNTEVQLVVCAIVDLNEFIVKKYVPTISPHFRLRLIDIRLKRGLSVSILLSYVYTTLENFQVAVNFLQLLARNLASACKFFLLLNASCTKIY